MGKTYCNVAFEDSYNGKTLNIQELISTAGETNIMRDSSDSMFYGAYGAVFISLGIWVLFWALDFITSTMALLLWIFTLGIIVMGTGFRPAKAFKTIRGRRREPYGAAFGFFLIILALSLLGVVIEVITLLAALAIIIIFTGIGIFVFSMMIKK